MARELRKHAAFEDKSETERNVNQFSVPVVLCLRAFVFRAERKLGSPLAFCCFCHDKLQGESQLTYLSSDTF